MVGAMNFLAHLTGGLLLCLTLQAQSAGDGHQPTPVIPASLPGQPPSDAIVLFDGKDISQWQYKDGRAGAWPIVDGVLTCKSGTGNLYTKRRFGSGQIRT